MNGKIGVIIPAGGNGSRMGGIYKPLEKLCGKEMLCYSLETFQNNSDVAFVVISAKEDKIEDIENLCKKYGYSKVKLVVKGGNDRQSSVENAFRCGLFDGDETEYVAIHDAARPLFDGKMAEKVFAAVKENKSSVCACRVRDTVKRTDVDCVVNGNVDRDSLWLIQTPQVFAKELYSRALDYANAQGFSATDDSSLIINLGEKVNLCEMPSSNIKVTFPEDVFLAEAILRYRKDVKVCE